MNISYERKVAPSEATCCFLSPSSRSQQFVSPSSKVFGNKNTINKKETAQGFRDVNEGKYDIQAMKKSVSSISLKKKNSYNFNTNRTSLNQSQFIYKSQKKSITNSMDSQVFRQNFPTLFDGHASNSNLSLNSANDGYRLFENLNYRPFEDLNKSNFSCNTESLETLAQKFKKNRQCPLQTNIESTKKSAFKPYQFSKYHKDLNLQKTSNKDCKNDYKPIQRYQVNKNFTFSEFQQKQKNMKNPELFANINISQKKGHININTDQVNKISREMNQVDSVIISLNGPRPINTADKSLFAKKQLKFCEQNRKLSQSIHYTDSNISKTVKKQGSNKKNLFNNEDYTFNSDYEDQEHEIRQKIQESAIMMNFFNPPPHIKQKLSLSRSHQKQRTTHQKQ